LLSNSLQYSLRFTPGRPVHIYVSDESHHYASAGALIISIFVVLRGKPVDKG